jgi:SatD family (SatD)
VQFLFVAHKRAMTTNRHAVLIADVIGSRTRKDLRAVLAKRLAAATRTHLKAQIRLPYAVTAGDEFQTILAARINIPELIFDLRSKLRPLRLRIGIGFGQVSGRVQQPVNLMGGEAFQRARRALEGVKQDNSKYDVLTAFQSGNEIFDSTANLIYALQDTLLIKVTNKQWDTIQAYRADRSLGIAARILKLNRSTVSRNLKRGYFWQIERTISAMDRLIRASKV